jgi:hypothetical protein
MAREEVGKGVKTFENLRKTLAGREGLGGQKVTGSQVTKSSLSLGWVASPECLGIPALMWANSRELSFGNLRVVA